MKPKRGGSRPGAGRRKKPDKRVNLTVSLPPVAELVARLRRVLSFGVTCTSGLDDEEFFPALDALLDTLDTLAPSVAE